jgi:ABC-type uncharacterized transport system permease subunit
MGFTWHTKLGIIFFINNIKNIPMTSGGYLLGITTSATWRVWATGIYANGKFASIFFKAWAAIIRFVRVSPNTLRKPGQIFTRTYKKILVRGFMLGDNAL